MMLLFSSALDAVLCRDFIYTLSLNYETEPLTLYDGVTSKVYNGDVGRGRRGPDPEISGLKTQIPEVISPLYNSLNYIIEIDVFNN